MHFLGQCLDECPAFGSQNHCSNIYTLSIFDRFPYRLGPGSFVYNDYLVNKSAGQSEDQESQHEISCWSSVSGASGYPSVHNSHGGLVSTDLTRSLSTSSFHPVTTEPSTFAGLCVSADCVVELAVALWLFCCTESWVLDLGSGFLFLASAVMDLEHCFDGITIHTAFHACLGNRVSV